MSKKKSFPERKAKIVHPSNSFSHPRIISTIRIGRLKYRSPFQTGAFIGIEHYQLVRHNYSEGAGLLKAVLLDRKIDRRRNSPLFCRLPFTRPFLSFVFWPSSVPVIKGRHRSRKWLLKAACYARYRVSTKVGSLIKNSLKLVPTVQLARYPRDIFRGLCRGKKRNERKKKMLDAHKVTLPLFSFFLFFPGRKLDGQRTLTLLRFCFSLLFLFRRVS